MTLLTYKSVVKFSRSRAKPPALERIAQCTLRNLSLDNGIIWQWSDGKKPL